MVETMDQGVAEARDVALLAVDRGQTKEDALDVVRQRYIAVISDIAADAVQYRLDAAPLATVPGVRRFPPPNRFGGKAGCLALHRRIAADRERQERRAAAGRFAWTGKTARTA